MIVVFGSINIDLFTRVERLPAPGETALGPRLKIAPGGKGANQALAVAEGIGLPAAAPSAAGRALAEDARAGRPVVASDTNSDLALLKDDFHPQSLAVLRGGETVAVIGFPLAGSLSSSAKNAAQLLITRCSQAAAKTQAAPRSNSPGGPHRRWYKMEYSATIPDTGMMLGHKPA